MHLFMQLRRRRTVLLSFYFYPVFLSICAPALGERILLSLFKFARQTSGVTKISLFLKRKRLKHFRFHAHSLFSVFLSFSLSLFFPKYPFPCFETFFKHSLLLSFCINANYTNVIIIIIIIIIPWEMILYHERYILISNSCM